ncbi:hypothetical protein AAMO2058_001088800, partial [Amorphochlora amoebiformis]
EWENNSTGSKLLQELITADINAKATLTSPYEIFTLQTFHHSILSPDISQSPFVRKSKKDPKK